MKLTLENAMIRNVILLTIDALRWDSLGCHGRQPTLTPNMDRIAEDGVQFTQAISCGGWTRPSLTGMLSSTFPSMYGGSWGPFHDYRPSLAALLYDQGITTAAFVSNPQIGRAYGFDRGFECFEESEPTYAGPGWAYLPGVQRLLQLPQVHHLFSSLGVKTAPPAITATAKELTNRLANWLAHQSSPFFAWVHYMDTHWPYHVSQELSDAKEIAQAWKDLQIMFVCSKHQGWMHPGESHLQHVVTAYRRAVSYVDWHLGNLIRSLEKMNLLDSTAIIITADHGEEFFEHGRWSHYQLYDENIRVPLLIRLPGSPSGVKANRLVSLMDLAPTILQLMGLSRPDDMLGHSLLPLLEKENAAATSPSEEVYTESMWSDNYRLAIRTEEFKYIYDAQASDEPELYDLQIDPGEKTNIWRREPELARRFEELRIQHQATVTKTNDVSIAKVNLDAQVQARLNALGYLD